jgi:hypothetical protein
MSTVAAGLALSLIGAPLAMAQADQHPGPQSAPHSDDVHATGPQHAPEQHTTVEHSNNTHTMATNTMPHQMTQVSHEQAHPAPPPMQHQASFSGHQWHKWRPLQRQPPLCDKLQRLPFEPAAGRLPMGPGWQPIRVDSGCQRHHCQRDFKR